MTTKDYSLLLPTRDRPGLVKQLFESIVETTSEPDRLEIVLYTDEEDLQGREIGHPLLSITRLTGKNETMGSVTRRCYDRSQGKYVMLINDDMIFRTKNWDKIALEHLLKFPDGVALVYGNDLYYGKRMPTFPIFPRKTCELMDKICSMQYKKHCIDPHVLDVFNCLEKLGHHRRVYMPRVIFEHMHYEIGTLMRDPGDFPASDAEDQEIYFSLAGHRQMIAMKMAEHIEKIGMTPPSHSPYQVESGKAVAGLTK